MSAHNISASGGAVGGGGSATVIFPIPNSQCNLFIAGSTNAEWFGSTPLYSHGFGFIGGSGPTLFIATQFNSFASMPLVLYAPIPAFAAGTTLYVTGSTHPGAAGEISLFLASFISVASATMVLSIAGNYSDMTSACMNLWTGSFPQPATGTVALFACNTISTNNQLFTESSDDITTETGLELLLEQASPPPPPPPGVTVESGQMNLFVKQPFGLSLNLFIKGPGTPVSISTSLFVTGDVPLSSSVELAMPKTYGVMTKSPTLHVNGW